MKTLSLTSFQHWLRQLWGSFSVRVFLYLMAAMISLHLIFNLIFIRSQQQIISRHITRQSMAVTELFADNIRIGVFSENMALIANTVASVLRQKHVKAVLVLKKTGELLVEKEKHPGTCSDGLKSSQELLRQKLLNGESSLLHETKKCLFYGAPVILDTYQGRDQLYFDDSISAPDGPNRNERSVGFVAISFDKKGLGKSNRRLILEHSTIFLVFLLFSSLITYLIVRQTVGPIINLIEMVKHSDAHVDAPDQIGILRNSFSSLVARLEDSFNTISKLKHELENLTRELLKTQEEERQKLAFDLHDDVAQELSSLRISCSTMLDAWPTAPESLKDKTNEMSALLQKTIATVRNLSYDLQPPDLEQLGFSKAIFRLCDDFTNANNLKLDFLVSGFDHYEPDFNTAINCYRIVQEALNNIKKHAKASKVHLRMVATYPSVIIRIRDDGIGFDHRPHAEQVPSRHCMGLKNMEKRASLLNGNLKIKSTAGIGTRIFIKLPYHANQQKKLPANGTDC